MFQKTSLLECVSKPAVTGLKTRQLKIILTGLTLHLHTLIAT